MFSLMLLSGRKSERRLLLEAAMGCRGRAIYIKSKGEKKDVGGIRRAWDGLKRKKESAGGRENDRKIELILKNPIHMIELE